MSSAIAVPPAQLTKKDSRKWLSGRGLLLLLVFIAAVVCIFGVVCVRVWPFGEKSVIENLQEASDSHVEVRGFHSTFFHPGCTLDGVVFTHGTAGKPLITIKRLTIQGTYLGILRHRVSRITAEGMWVVIPPFGSGQAFHTQHSSTTIDEIVANGATLEFASQNPGKPPLRFDIREARLGGVGWTNSFTYRLKVHNPEPPGEITTTGKFGPWNQPNAGQTPIAGEYQFEKADLSVYRGIAGTLASSGKYEGNLGHIDISGSTDTPDFEVKSGGHPLRLVTEFSAYVDATHGDTFLKRVDAHFRKTHVVATGSIAGSAEGEGKVALIDLSADKGRIEDLVGLVVKGNRAPISGAITLRARAEIPAGDRPFLERIKLRGGFGIGGGKFSNPSTQEGVNKLSAGAQGEKNDFDPETALTDLTGKVLVKDGLANFPDLTFGVPGAAARMHGTYNLIDYKIDLHGQMKVDTKISNTTTGAKALLLKMMDPFFKKRKKGEILPVRISGTYQNPSFGLDLEDKQAQVPPPRTRSTPTPH